MKKEIKKNSTRSSIPHVEKGFVLEMETIVPINISKINLILKIIREMIVANNEEISNIIAVRDILLPKLMSGEIDVSKIKVDLKTLFDLFFYFLKFDCFLIYFVNSHVFVKISSPFSIIKFIFFD